MAQLAADIIEKCKYIHPSRTEEVEQLLIRLRKHSLANPAPDAAGIIPKSEDPRDRRANPSRDEPQSNVRRSKTSADNLDNYDSHNGNNGRRESTRNEHNNNERAPPARSALDMLPPARMDELEDYQEMLYQVAGKSEKEREAGLAVQVKGTAMILKLCRDVMNLEQLIQNPTVMGALTRVLQEEFKKSVDLTFNILR